MFGRKQNIEDTIRQIVEKSDLFKRMKIRSSNKNLSVSMIDLEGKDLQQYTENLEERAKAGILARVDNDNSSIYGSVYHYERKMKTPNGVEGCLEIYPGLRFTGINLFITNDGIDTVANESGDKASYVNAVIEQRLKAELIQLTNDLLIPEINTILNIRELKRGNDVQKSLFILKSIKDYKVEIKNNYEIKCLGEHNDYFDCYTSASISLPDTQIDRYIQRRLRKGDLQKRTESSYGKEIKSSEDVEGSFVIMDRIKKGQISLQVVIPGEIVQSIHDDNNINEKEKNKKIQRTLRNFANKELRSELEFLFSIIQEQTQSNSETTR